MSNLPGTRFDITGASGSTGFLGPKSGWRAIVLPRGGYASQDSTGTLYTFDSADIASRFAVNAWTQVGLNVANIRQVSAVGGNSVAISGANVTVSQNDRIYLIGNTQPTVTGGSATYTTPDTIIRQRDDSAAALFTNSLITSDTNGLIQFYSDPTVYDVIIQDGDQSNQGSLVNLAIGAEGVSTDLHSIFGGTVTINAAFGVTGIVVFGETVTAEANFIVSGSAQIARLGPVSGASSGGAVRIVDGTLWAQTGAGIIAALGDLPAEGGEVKLMGGSYAITSSITIGSSQTIGGVGKATILDVVGNSINVFIMAGDSTQHWTLRDLRITDSQGDDDYTGLFLGDFTGIGTFNVENIWMDNQGTGIRGSADDTKGGNTATFRNVYIRNGVDGITLLSNLYGQYAFVGCGAFNNSGIGLRLRTRQVGIGFYSCDFENNALGNVLLEGCLGLGFYSLHTEGAGQTVAAVTMLADPDATTIHNQNIGFYESVISSGADYMLDVGDASNVGARGVIIQNCRFGTPGEAFIRTRSNGAVAVGIITNPTFPSGVSFFDTSNVDRGWYLRVSENLGPVAGELSTGQTGDQGEGVRFLSGADTHYWQHWMTAATDRVYAARVHGNTNDQMRLLVNGEMLIGGGGGVAPTVGRFVGSGTPESAVTAGIGSIFQRTDGGAGTSLYVKETGTGNTGWVGK